MTSPGPVGRSSGATGAAGSTFVLVRWAAGHPTAVLDGGRDAMVTHPGAPTDLLTAGRSSPRP